ncbi:hypothetical protein D3C71_1747870 [compost metagenome]
MRAVASDFQVASFEAAVDLDLRSLGDCVPDFGQAVNAARGLEVGMVMVGGLSGVRVDPGVRDECTAVECGWQV